MSKIDYILQVGNQNMLQVVYKSRVNRFIFPDSSGNYEVNMTKTQQAFMNNSYMVVMPNADGWGRSFYYYLDKDDPNQGVLSAIRVKEKLYGGVDKSVNV